MRKERQRESERVIGEREIKRGMLEKEITW